MEREEILRNQYWYLYQDAIYKSYYYSHYKTRSTRINHAIIVLLLASSLAGVSGLWFWQKYPTIWSVIAACIQIISASSFILPYAEQIWAIGHLQPDLDMLIAQIDHDWNLLDGLGDDEINDLIYSYTQKLLDMEQKYIGSIHFPSSNRCKKYAIKDREAFNQERFNIEPNNQKQEDSLHVGS